MNCSIKILLQTLFLSLCILNVTASRGRHSDSIGSKEWRAVRAARRRRAATSSAVEVQGLDILKTYVCPPCANAIKRQVEVQTGTTTISIPNTDLEALFAELEALLAQLAAILNQQGISITASATVTPPLSISGSSTILSIPALTILSGATAAGDDALVVIDSTVVVETPVTPIPQPSTLQAAATTTDANGVVRVTVTQFTTITYTAPAQDSSTTDPASLAMTDLDSGSATQLATSSSALTNLAALVSDSPAAYSSIDIAVMVSSIAAASTDSEYYDDEASTSSTFAEAVAAAATIGTKSSVSVATSSTTDPARAAASTESVCYDDDDDEETSTSSMPLVFQPSSTFAENVAGAAIATTNSASVAASSTTIPTGGVFVQLAATAASTAAAAAASNGYTFNALSRSNINVYFGQTPVTSGTTLVAQCADPNVDIITLSFIIANAYEGTEYPQVNFGAACGGQTAEMMASAPGLLYCPDLAGMISSCQTTYGKKVLLSIGGSASSIAFSESSEATSFGDILWQLFGPPGSIDIGLRPFGNVTIDGFDIDNEDNEPANYDVLGSTLKTNFATDSSKEYFLTSAPQCPFPDASDPQSLILMCDFVFVQFYNNPPCEIGSAGFAASVSQWSSFLETSTLATKPRLYVGAPAWSAAGPTAYANIIASTGNSEGIEPIAKNLTTVSNLGGMSFWDGPEGLLNVADGKDIIAWAKTGLAS